MKKTRLIQIVVLVVALLVSTLPVRADVLHGTIAASGASATLNINSSHAVRSIHLAARVANTDGVYVRVWRCGETVVAATTADYPLGPGNTIKLTHDPTMESGAGYCNVSYIVGSGTQTFDWIAK